MTDQKQITLEEALKIVEFEFVAGAWRVKFVHGSVWGDVEGDVEGDVKGNVEGDVWGNVGGNVGGTIKGRKWQFIETPREKLRRLIEEGAHKSQLLEAIYQLENNND